MAYAQLTQAKAQQIERKSENRKRININKRSLRKKQEPSKSSRQDKLNR